jgi:hypothetical protein
MDPNAVSPKIYPDRAIMAGPIAPTLTAMRATFQMATVSPESTSELDEHGDFHALPTDFANSGQRGEIISIYVVITQCRLRACILRLGDRKVFARPKLRMISAGFTGFLTKRGTPVRFGTCPYWNEIFGYDRFIDEMANVPDRTSAFLGNDSFGLCARLR